MRVRIYIHYDGKDVESTWSALQKNGIPLKTAYGILSRHPLNDDPTVSWSLVVVG